jgi:hypothetical protein
MSPRTGSGTAEFSSQKGKLGEVCSVPLGAKGERAWAGLSGGGHENKQGQGPGRCGLRMVLRPEGLCRQETWWGLRYHEKEL